MMGGGSGAGTWGFTRNIINIDTFFAAPQRSKKGSNAKGGLATAEALELDEGEEKETEEQKRQRVIKEKLKKEKLRKRYD